MDVKNSKDLECIKVPDKIHEKLKGFYACGSNYISKKDLDFFISYLIKEYGEDILFSDKAPTTDNIDNVELTLKSFINLSILEKVEFLKRIEPIKSKLEI